MFPAQAQISETAFIIYLVLTVLVVVVLLSIVFYLLVKDRKSRDEVHDLKNQLSLLKLQKEIDDEEKNSNS